MRVLRGVERVELDRWADVRVDLGTGDGKFVLRAARAEPEALHVGVDALAEPMEASASRAARKPERGGAPNALFVACDALSPPAALAGRASLVTVNYPWGSLLRAVGEPEPAGLSAVAGLLAPGGRIVALLNASAAEDAAYAERRDLPALEVERLAAGWRAAGLAVEDARLLAPGEEPPHRTSWGQRLVRGSGRETLLVSAVRSSASP
ncbi:MAG TPA: class I SAM-dependent methyltransferase [Thermoleophilaceae bacterium]|jgi:16S rRNA (adenine(1408)-N(1))-methyltransferase